MTTVTRPDIVLGLRRLGVVAGDVILVHSSLKSFGFVDGGADAVIDALLDAVAPGGTVAVPTLTGTRDDSPAKPPRFDVGASPCWTGLIPETFRGRAEARRSLHPTHSVAAIGSQAGFLTGDHLSCATPCGDRSPYLRLAELDGKVIFLGVTLDCCTLLHGAEEIAGVDYVLQPEPVRATVTDEQGRTTACETLIHSWSTPRRFAILEPILLRDGVMQIGKVGDAEVRVVRARPLVERVLALLRQSPRLLCAPGEHPRP